MYVTQSKLIEKECRVATVHTYKKWIQFSINRRLIKGLTFSVKIGI